MANIKNEAKNNYEFSHLIQDLYKLLIELLNKEEQLAIENILRRNFFGHLHFSIIPD